MLNVLIVDDEVAGARTLQILLTKYCPEVNVLGIAYSAAEAEEKIAALSPELIFLDVAMPSVGGFELLSRIKNINFEVIFTTAHNEYAIKAIRHNALDYLLKPIQRNELTDAVKKCIEKKSKGPDDMKRIEKMMDSLTKSIKKKKIPVHTLEGILYIDQEEVIRFEGDGNYTNIHLLKGNKIVSSKTLKDYEQVVEGEEFFRIHKTHIVNLNYIKMYSKGDGGQVVMVDGVSLDISKQKKLELLALLPKG